MEKCPRCGARAEAGDRFCGACGYRLGTNPTGAALTSKDLNAADIRYRLALVYYKMGNYDKAVDVLERVIEQEPENAEAKELMEKARDACNLNAGGPVFN